MSMSAVAQYFGSDPLQPAYEGAGVVELPINIAPSTTLAKGTVLGQITSSANDVQTLTISGSPTGGTFTLNGTNPLTGLSFTTAALAYNCAASDIQTELRSSTEFGLGNVNVTGSGPFTITFTGTLANLPVPVMTLGTNALTGGSSPTASVAHTTVGRTAGTYAAYSAAVAAVPGAPTVTGTGSGSGWAAGTHNVAVTGVNAQGETTASVPAGVTLTAGQKIHVAALSSLDSSFTALNVYVDGTFVGTAAVSSGTSTATDFDIATEASADKVPPSVNTAYTVPNGAGTQTPVCILKYNVTTDASGNISPSYGLTGGEWGQTEPSTPAYFRGVFRTSDLTGLDANAVNILGRLWAGTVSSGVLSLI